MSEQHKLVGICGPAGAGKSTLGLDLRTGTTAKPISRSFARAVKEAALPAIEAFGPTVTFGGGDVESTSGWHAELLDLQRWKAARYPCGTTVRDILIQIGMDARAKDPDHWVNVVREQIREDRRHDKPSLTTICDLRFDNEAQMILDEGGFIVEIVRDGLSYDPDNPPERGLDFAAIPYDRFAQVHVDEEHRWLFADVLAWMRFNLYINIPSTLGDVI